MGVEETKTEAKKTISNGSKFPEKAAESVTEKKEVDNGVKEMEVDKKDVENEAEERTDGNGKEEVRAVEEEELMPEKEQEEKKDSEKSSSKKRKAVEKTPEPMTPGIDRPVRERKSVERLVATIENDASKEFHIEKGQGTLLNDLPNVTKADDEKVTETEEVNESEEGEEEVAVIVIDDEDDYETFLALCRQCELRLSELEKAFST